ncbi:MAG: hypothetical protein V4650_11140 [Pseudomonadota bacterium]
MFSAAIATKLFVSPLLIGLASLAGKRWGPAISGLLGGLPLVGAPVVLVLWMADGQATALRAALTAPIGVWATMVYLLVFGFASRRFRWWGALGIGWVSYLAMAAALHYSGLDQQTWLGLLVIPTLLLVATRVLPRPSTPPEAVRLPPQELLARMLAAVGLVLLLTTVASFIGPDFTGVLAGAPVAATVIPSFTLAMAGRDPLLRVLRGFISGLMGFAAFFLVLAAAMPPLGWLALLPAVVVAVLVGMSGARLLHLHALRHGRL